MRKITPSFELWIFAARYSFIELEKYCRCHEQVFPTIVKTLRSPSEGIGTLINFHISISIISEIVCDILKEAGCGNIKCQRYILRGSRSAPTLCDDCLRLIAAAQM